MRVADINPGSGSSGPFRLTNLNGTLFFTANDGSSGYELWKSDGTAAGTVRVADINPGPANSTPFSLRVIGNTLFFSATTGFGEQELWSYDVGGGGGNPRVNDGTASFSLTGTPAVGQTLNATQQASDPDGAPADGITYYQWQRSVDAGVNWVTITGAASGSYQLTNDELGKQVRVLITYIDGESFRESIVTAPVTVGANPSGSGPILVKDIFPGPFGSAFPQNFTNVNGTLFFTASDGSSGFELWKSDGTAAGTVCVADINPGYFSTTGPVSSSPGNLTNVNGTLFFTADDGSSGVELWKSDGTAAGTVRVADLIPGSAGSSPSFLTNLNGTLFFAAFDYAKGSELWKSDGTAAGTVRVADIIPGSGSSSPRNLTNVNGTLFFTANDGSSGYELWKSDGTALGTKRVADINSGSGSSGPFNLTSVNGTLFFTANDGSSGIELWKSDGTALGTKRVSDINPGPGGSGPFNLTSVNGTLFFTANDGSRGSELWKSDGTTAGTIRVADINSGANSSYPRYLTNINGTLFFDASDGSSGYELWKSDGTAAGTVRVADINPGSGSSGPFRLTNANVNSTLFFTANDGSSGYELWKSDGTATGTVRVADINPGPANSSPFSLLAIGNTLYFSATTATGEQELWSYKLSGIVIINVVDDLGSVVRSITDGGATNDTTPTISGTLSAALKAGESLRVFNGTTALGDATVNGTIWSFTPTLPATAGTSYVLRAWVVDAAGTLGTQSAPFTFTIDTEPPTAVATITTVAGSIIDGGFIIDPKPLISGTLSAALGSGESLLILNGTTVLGTATVNNTTLSWFYTPTFPATAGTNYVISARVADAAGNLGPRSVIRSFTLDTTAPATSATITAVFDNTGPLQGFVANNSRTDDTTPTISGTLSAALEAGETLRMFDGTRELGDAIVNGTSWSFNPTLPATEGTSYVIYVITARVIDAAGNLGTPSASRSFLLDTTVPLATPTITDVVDNLGTVTGSIAAGGVTNDTTPTISGTLSAALGSGDSLQILNGSTILGTATVNTTTLTWSYTFFPTLPATAGTRYVISARVVDGAGSLGPQSAARTFTLDTTTPATTATITGVLDDTGLLQGPVAAGGRTDDPTPTISGTLSVPLEAGETLRLFNGSIALGDATVNGTSWTYIPTLPATASTIYAIYARVVDAAGNLGPQSAIRSFTLDTTAPTSTPTIDNVFDNVGTITEVIADGWFTNDTTPTISVTLPAAFPLGSGEIVQILSGSTVLGTATFTTTNTVWSYTPTLPATAGTTYVISARVIDAAGNLGPLSAPRSFTLDTTAPATTATITGVLDDRGELQGPVAPSGRTDDTTPTISGTLFAALEAGETLRMFNGATLLGTAIVNNTDLTWLYTPTLPATEGTPYAIRARVADAAGNLGPQSTARSFTLDTTAPTVSATITDVVDNVGTITGSIVDGGVTNDTTPTIRGTLSSALGSGESLQILNGTTVLGTASVNTTDLTWTYTPTLPATEGTSYVISARVVDGAGSLGPQSAPRSFLLDTTARAIIVTITDVLDDTGLQQGPVANTGRTDDTTPTLSGTLSAALGEGESLKLYSGTTVLADAVVDNAALTWSATPSLTTDASYSITARVVDAAGNQGSLSASRSLILDTTAPTQVVAITNITDNVGTLQGSVADGAITNDTTPTLSGTFGGATAGAALATGETLRIYSNGATFLGNATVNRVANGQSTWTYTPATPLTTNGTYSFTAQVIDGAGNSGPLSDPRSIVLDTIAPTQTVFITSVSDNTDPVQGVVAAGGRINDTTPTLTGTLSAALGEGESLKLYRGTTVLVDAVVDNAALTWSAIPSLTTDATYAITARVVDAAGNQGSLSASRSLILDTTAPTQAVAITNITDNVGTLQGSVADGAITNDTRPTLSGTFGGATAGAALATGETLRIYSNGATFLGNATVDRVANGQSTWNYTPATPLTTNGTYSFTAQVIDGAGNGGPLSTPRSMVLDASSPTQTVTISAVNDDTGLVQGVVAANGRTNDLTPTISGILTAPLASGESLQIRNGTTVLGTANVNTDLTWACTPSLFETLGTDYVLSSNYAISARVVDAAGNLGPQSATRSFTLDTVAPNVYAYISDIRDDRDPVTGSILNGGVTNDTTPTISGTLSAALGSGDSLQILNGSTVLGKAIVKTNTSYFFTTTWTWTYTPTLPDPAGAKYDIFAAVVDAAGNVGFPSNTGSFYL